jgi:hypothetical protein
MRTFYTKNYFAFIIQILKLKIIIILKFRKLSLAHKSKDCNINFQVLSFRK